MQDLTQGLDENMLKLFRGQMQALHCVCVALEATGKLDRETLLFTLGEGLSRLPDDDELSSAAMAFLQRAFDPQTPPRPVLTLIDGGKK